MAGWPATAWAWVTGRRRARGPGVGAEVVDLGPEREILGIGRAVVAAPDGTSVLVVRTRRGIFAVANSCPHRGLPLDHAPARGQTITCPAHQRRYDLRSGQQRGAARRARPLVSYRAWRENGRILLGIRPARPQHARSDKEAASAVLDEAR